MNADVTLSLTIVEGKRFFTVCTKLAKFYTSLSLCTANVAAIFLHKNARHLLDEHRNSLMTILKLCDSTRRDLLDAIVPENKDVQLRKDNYPHRVSRHDQTGR